MGDNITVQKRNKWITQHQKKFPSARADVLGFIWDVNYAQGTAGEGIINSLFSAGYCYYFARMLQDAFGGDLYWHKGHSHIVWGDGENPIYYDIYGVFYDYEEGDIVDYRLLGETLESFRHRGHDGDLFCEISNYATSLGKTTDELLQEVYDAIPDSERIFPYYNLGDAEIYWSKYKLMLQGQLKVINF